MFYMLKRCTKHGLNFNFFRHFIWLNNSVTLKSVHISLDTKIWTPFRLSFLQLSPILSFSDTLLEVLSRLTEFGPKTSDLFWPKKICINLDLFRNFMTLKRSKLMLFHCTFFELWFKRGIGQGWFQFSSNRWGSFGGNETFHHWNETIGHWNEAQLQIQMLSKRKNTNY